MKNVLLIVPQYFGYETYIAKEIERLGYRVYPIYENLAHFDYKYRFLSNYCKNVIPKYERKYYYKQLDLVKDDIDYVLVIRGSSLSEEIMERICSLYPKAKKVMYQWDSVRNNPKAGLIARYFDSISTFDVEDANRLEWKYRPLFYIGDFCLDSEKTVDFACVTSFQPNRVKLANRIEEISQNSGLKTYIYIFIPFITVFRHKYLMHDANFKDLNYKLYSKSIGIEQTNDIYNKSRIVVDFTPSSQNGFTMRTIESIGHRCKLITNNTKVLEADFYDPQNVFVYDECAELNIPEEFLATDYKSLSDEVYKSYSLSSFVSDLLTV